MQVDIFDTDKKYKIIYSDPCWWFPPRNNSKTKFGGGATDKYSVMKLDEIKKLPIPDIADDNCALFQWSTTSSTSDSNIQQKLELFEYWGFRLVNIGFSWMKTNKKNGKPFYGIGNYTASNMEHCWLGIKGKMKKENSVSSVIIHPRMEHSRKPIVIKDKIVQLFGDLPRIELFARESNDASWDYWGNEVNKFN